MIPLVCPTCRDFLGNKQLYYEKGLEEICKKQKMNKYKSDNEFENEKEKLFNNLELRRYCCKMLFLTYVPLIDIIE
jgi:DNA-directed RNA polymerase subunit N (RpoN/RPB10)